MTANQMYARRGGNPGGAQIIRNARQQSINTTPDATDEGLVSVYDGRTLLGTYVGAGRKFIAYRATDEGLVQVGGVHPSRVEVSAAIRRIEVADVG